MGHGPITFRPLRRDDFGRLATWLAEPRVARWWNHDHSPEAIERDFGTSVDGGDATEMFAVQLDGEPVGFIQRYPIAAYAEYVQESRGCARSRPAPSASTTSSAIPPPGVVGWARR